MIDHVKAWVRGRLSSTTRQLLGPHVGGLLVQSGEFKFLVDPQDYGVGRHLRLRGQYGGDELARILPLVDDRSNVLVVGTHVGSLAIPLARHCRRVVGIEANPDTYQLVSMNRLLNGVENLDLHHFAASDQAQSIEFLCNRSNSGGSKIKPVHDDYRYRFDAPRTIRVDAHRLDEKLRDQQFDLILMDIEGSEYFALRGMPELLTRAKHIIVEFVPHHLQNVSGVSIADFLTALPGFEWMYIPSTGQTIAKQEFHAVLQSMFDEGRDDDGIVFSKHRLNQNDQAGERIRKAG